MVSNLELKEVGGHTFCPSLLSDGCVIDIGCRGGVFSNEFTDIKVFCIDPDPKVFTDTIDDVVTWKDEFSKQNLVLMNIAISDVKGESAYYENGEATCLQQIDPDQNHPFIPCKTITMDDLYEITGTNVDILKLDCEGAEYIILGETFKPIPKQISVEFHNHCVPELHNKHYASIIERLSKDYVMMNDVWEQRHGCGFNFWNTLFIRKDLL